MSKKTVITQVAEMGSEGGINVFFPQNKVLYADQFTDYAPGTKDDFAVFAPKTIDEVFEHYRPSLEGLFLSDENGDSRYENFSFGCISDFDDDSLISQSEILSNGAHKRDTFYSIIRNMERNREIIRLMRDPKAKDALKNAFKAMRKELDEPLNE